VLSPVARGANGTASADLSLYSKEGTEPVAVEWTLHFPLSSISSVAVEDGPALKPAGKIVLCAGRPGISKCLVTGTNNKTIENGIIARLSIVVAPGSSKGGVQIKNSLAVSAAGREIPVSARIMPASGAHSPSDCREAAAPAQPK
jgi:hypothetical protein